MLNLAELIRQPPWASGESGGICFESITCRLRPESQTHPVEIPQVNDRCGEQRERLAHDESTDDGDAERAAHFRSRAGAQSQRELRREAQPWWSS